MTKPIQTPRRLSNMQAVLLQMFETDLSENDLMEVKNLLSRFLFRKAEEAADKAMREKGSTLEQIEEEMENNIEKGSRTEYLRKLRASEHESGH